MDNRTKAERLIDLYSLEDIIDEFGLELVDLIEILLDMGYDVEVVPV